MSKLKPCPWCGSDGRISKAERSAIGGFFGECANSDDDCCVQPETGWYNTEAEAITAWNTRAAPTMKAWEWVESNAHGPAWKCDTFKALTYLAAGEWHVYIDLIFVGSVVASVQDAPELAKAIGVAYVERKLKEWLI